jgi:hypothetical protein
MKRTLLALVLVLVLRLVLVLKFLEDQGKVKIRQ